MNEKTDREVLLDMFKRAGIEPANVSESEVFIERGYVGFVTVFSFKPDGSLEDVCAQE